MTIKSVQQLLTEQLGKKKCDVIGTTAMTGKDYYAIYFPVESVVADITATNVQAVTGSSATRLQTTYPAGTTLFLAVTAITLTSGIAICYYDAIS